MIKNFNQWDRMQPLNEDAKSSVLKAVAKQTGMRIDDIVKSGFKGVGNLFRRLFGASADDVAKFDKGLSDVIGVQKTPWWQSLSKEAKKSLEKEGDEVVKKYVSAYNAGDESLLSSARTASKEYLKKAEKIGTEQKAIDDLTANIEGLPSRRLKNKYMDTLKSAQSSVDDAARTGDMDKLAAARKYVEETDSFMKSAGKKSVYTRPERMQYGRRGILGRGLEPGADLADEATAGLASKGKDGLIKTIRKETYEEGRTNLSEVSRVSRSSQRSEGGGIWNGFKRNLKRAFVLGAAVYGGGVAWNYLKGGQEEKAVESFKTSLDEMKKRFMDEGVSLTKINMNTASFGETFGLFFAGTGEDLPVDDAKELGTMMKAGSTMSDFFSKTSQLCFEYPERYFKESEDKMKKSSSFYGFVEKLNEKIGVAKLVSAVSQADGMASVAIEDSFFENGSPISLDEYGYASFSNPNMKILLGSNMPVNAQDLVDESKDFIKMFSAFKRKIANDSIQSGIVASLKDSGMITQEEFEERSRRIEQDLSGQLSEKEEAFVAMTGLILSYNSGNEPFKQFYGFDDNDLYSTVDSINELMDTDFDLRSRKQLSRMYRAIGSEFSDVYKEMGKERSLYGVMEFSTFGNVMRSIMNLYALEKVCRIIAKSEAGDLGEDFSREEIEEYQKVINQIQKKEGKTPDVSPSGVLDDETESAIKDYQEKLGLPVTGKPGDKTLVKMKDYLVSMITSKTD